MKEVIKAVIIDDEADAIEVLSLLINKYCPQINVIGTFDSPQEALNELPKLDCELLFLDVEMPKLDGIQLLQQIAHLRDEFHVIFTTAHDQYALPALKEQAIDYLLKPIDPDDLVTAIEKLPFLKLKKLKVISSKGTELIDYNDILFAKASGSYAELYLLDGSKRTLSQGLKFIEREYQSKFSFKTHRSYLINLQHIVSYKIEKDKGMVTLKGGHEIPISRERKEAFKMSV
ncbi:MAG: LytTR family DNA-binding domain-containing protein [Flavobacteriales bacterium]|nr:LytTR family DNA-binding domain-containing protein [Flavobacteriales bacterium]